MAPDSEPDAAPLADAVGLRTHPLTAVTTGLLFSLPAAATLVLSSLQNGRLPDLPWWLLLLVPVLLAVGGFVVGTAVGFVSWYVTTYVIDGEEVRVDSGLLFRSSRRVPYERLQSVDIAEPLLARLVGLCELRLETAGGSDSRTSLKYLRLADARALRRVLLERADGPGVEAEPGSQLGETASDTAGSTVPARERRVISHVTPARLLLGTLVSLDLAASLVLGVAVLAVLVAVDAPFAAFGAAIPFATVLLNIVSHRVAAQWDSTLTEDRRGLRIERGLFTRTTQTVPWERIQGLAVEEPVVWRRLGWARLKVDVAGYGNDAGDGSGESTSTLVPVADRERIGQIVRHVLDVRPEEMERTGPPPRSWPFAPFVWRSRWVGADAVGFVGVEGWFQRRSNVVPHHKTQSVEVRQGPLQRRLGLATLEVHTPDGPVDADGRHLLAETARAIALEQVERARRARSRAHPAPVETS
ncbi:PH domain-containing protein [Aeromicrobium halocynthiae]|uniref:PH domain-containing protein n=1 Tax=Aeromicrobium halocynthiae TaxID=560557 RepID=A0ABN2W0F6_9ACTN